MGEVWTSLDFHGLYLIFIFTEKLTPLNGTILKSERILIYSQKD